MRWPPMNPPPPATTASGRLPAWVDTVGWYQGSGQSVVEGVRALEHCANRKPGRLPLCVRRGPIATRPKGEPPSALIAQWLCQCR